MKLSQNRLLASLLCVPLLWSASPWASNPSCQDALTRALTRDPVQTYEQILRAAREASARGEDSFTFEQGRSTLRKLIADLQAKNGNPAFAGLILRGTALEQAPLQYHAFWRFVLDYVHAIDAVVRAEHPELTSRYNEGLAAHLFEPFLARAPRAILFPAFESVDLEYFLNAKAAPVYLIGLVTEPTHADGYLLSPLEFFMHDLGHSDYMAVRDLQLLDDPSTPAQVRLRRWHFLARHLKQGRDQLRQKDPDLADAVQLLLFEILHERGFSYDATSLRLETDTEKWTDVVRRKFASVFFRGATDLNTRLFPRLTEARQWIGLRLRLLSEYENAPALRSLKNSGAAATFIHTPAAEYFYGSLHGIAITPDGEMTASFDTSTGIQATELYYNVSLAQVDALHPSPLTPAIIQKITLALANGASIQIDPSGSWSQSTQRSAPKKKTELSSLHLFKINQLLGLHARGLPATFSVPRPVQTYSGRVLRMSGNLGAKRVLIETPQGNVELPTAEIFLAPYPFQR